MINNDFYPDVYYGNCCGNAKNCLYSHKGIAKSADEFKAFLKYDHTFIQFKGNHRSKDNFIKANAVVFDCDNEFSDETSKWIHPETIADIFKNVRCIVYTSRNHMKQKGNKSARPRFHVIFPTEVITDATAYTDFTSTVCGMYSFFDDNAIDAGRFFFGNPDTEITVISGEKPWMHISRNSNRSLIPSKQYPKAKETQHCPLMRETLSSVTATPKKPMQSLCRKLRNANLPLKIRNCKAYGKAHKDFTKE